MQLTYPQASIGVQQCGTRICHTPCRCLIIYLQPCMSLTAMRYQSVPCSVTYKDLEHDYQNTSCTNIQEKGAMTRRTMTSRYDNKINYFDIHVTRNHDEFLLTLRLLMSYIYMEHLFLMFLDHTQWRTTVGRTPLEEWWARRRDLYLTTHDTHNRQLCCQVEVSAMSWSLVQRSPTDCGASLCVI